jgi:hypothetical protein
MARDKVDSNVKKTFNNIANPKPPKKRRGRKEREASSNEQRTARRIATLIKRTARSS